MIDEKRKKGLQERIDNIHRHLLKETANGLKELGKTEEEQKFVVLENVMFATNYFVTNVCAFGKLIGFDKDKFEDHIDDLIPKLKKTIMFEFEEMDSVLKNAEKIMELNKKKSEEIREKIKRNKEDKKLDAEVLKKLNSKTKKEVIKPQPNLLSTKKDFSKIMKRLKKDKEIDE